MGGYQVVNGYFTDEGTWVSPYLRGVPNGIEFDNVNYDPSQVDDGSLYLFSEDEQLSIDANETYPDPSESHLQSLQQIHLD